MTYDDNIVNIHSRLDALEGETIVPGKFDVIIEEWPIPAIMFLDRGTSDV